MNHAARLAVVPAATLAFQSLLVAAGPPAAASSCLSGTPFTVVTTGETEQAGTDHFWLTEAWGPASITLQSASPSLTFTAYTEGCNPLCSQVVACAFTYAGTVSLHVTGGAGRYVITALSAGVPASPAPTCNVVGAGGVCIDVTPSGDVVQQVSVYDVDAGTSPGSSLAVGGWVMQYRFPLPGGGSAVVPCVVLKAGATANGCAAAGGTYEGTVVTLVERSVAVPQPSAGLGDPLLTVRLCPADVTITANGFGVEDFPAYALC